MQTNLYLIRHGEAVPNVEPIIGGMRGDARPAILGCRASGGRDWQHAEDVLGCFSGAAWNRRALGPTQQHL
jgi:broad specificity phosphatase PhoE